MKEKMNEKKIEDNEIQFKAKFRISLAEWSLHKGLNSGEINNRDFANIAASMGFEGIEYVNVFFKDKAEDISYLDSLNLLAENAGVQQLLIMVDQEGNLATTDKKERNAAVENHKKWVRAAKHLGCHSIRVNAFGKGTEKEVGDAAVDGLGALADYAQGFGINVIVENHGSYSSNGKWLADVMFRINKANCGTLPDFGNFCIKREGGVQWGAKCIEEYDRYMGVQEMMPFAKAVSAKALDFDENGNEIHTDYEKMLGIVLENGFNGFIGVEYEGEELSEKVGIIATKKLLEKYQ